MAFNTVDFFIFWFLFYLLFLGTKNEFPLRNWILLTANLTFFTLLSGYAVLILLLFSTFDFLIGRQISKSSNEQNKIWLMRSSVILNIGLILIFKHICDWFQLNNMASPLHFPIPLMFVGVSFYAFRSMSYVFDVFYENIDAAEQNIFHYWTYASFFPIMLSGPLAKAGDFLEKLKATAWEISKSDINRASFYISSGIVKKFIIGNYLAINFVDRVFESAELFSSLEVFLAAIMQTFALYFDFSGYTDIAIGLAMMLGIKVAENFNFPFLAQNVSDYWKRWHISLSQWFNAYVYFPLSYALRKWKKFGTSLAVFIVFVVSGFWHGTAPNFWLWGVMHAICMVWDIYSANMRTWLKKYIPRFIYQPISVFLTFGFLTYSGIYFKSTQIEKGNIMIQKIINGVDWTLWNDWFELYSGVLWMALIGILGHYFMSLFYRALVEKIEKLHFIWSAIGLITIIVIAYQFERLGSLPFYYLQF